MRVVLLLQTKHHTWWFGGSVRLYTQTPTVITCIEGFYLWDFILLLFLLRVHTKSVEYIEIQQQCYERY